MAVKIGGGVNHRFGLYDMILIKDNHVDYAGSLTRAVEQAVQYLTDTGRSLPIEVEVRNRAEVEEALAVGHLTRMLLDNFSPLNSATWFGSSTAGSSPKHRAASTWITCGPMLKQGSITSRRVP